jgi:hypothetical protein
VNGDGFGDIVVGAPYDHRTDGGRDVHGLAYVYLGGPDGPQERPSFVIDNPADGDTGFGYSLAGAGDVNGDGYPDVVVGSPDRHGLAAGAAYLYLGGPTGLPATPSLTLVPPGAGDAVFGYAVASAPSGPSADVRARPRGRLTDVCADRCGRPRRHRPRS